MTFQLPTSDTELPPGPAAPEILDDRIWVDGCWDFFHHGHAGAMLQARQLGTELFVGIHSDEEILKNKGPTVMTLEERTSAIQACRWVTLAIPHAPYVTSLPYITHYGCRYVVHGDDITFDSSGSDCYRFVKAAGRFKVVKRTPSISTTDLVGRMLLCTKGHFLKDFAETVLGGSGHGHGHGGERDEEDEESRRVGREMAQRVRQYASGPDGRSEGAGVWFWRAANAAATAAGEQDDKQQQQQEEKGTFTPFTEGVGPRPGQRVVYIDGGFDLFSSGHIEFLRQVVKEEEQLGREQGWYDEQAVHERKGKGEDYGPVYVVAGVHDDEVINEWKGVNYPIMNIFERGLCVLQCKYISALIFSAPFTPTKTYLTTLPHGVPDAVYHGPTSFMPLTYDPYTAAKHMGIYKQIGRHAFMDVNAGEIVQRILRSRGLYEERQRVKGVKKVGEEEERRREREVEAGLS